MAATGVRTPLPEPVTLETAFATLADALQQAVADDLPARARIAYSRALARQGTLAGTQQGWQQLLTVLEGTLGVPITVR